MEAWIDRRFAFDVPTARISSLLSRLRGAPARIAAATRAVATQRLSERPAPIAWSVQDHVGHLHDLDTLHLTRLDELANGSDALSAADMSNRATWDANYHEQTFEAVYAAFADRRHKLVATLQKLDEDALQRAARHPRLDVPMRAIDVACFCAEHDDHHLTRIDALAESAIEDRAHDQATSSPWRDLPQDTPVALLKRHRIIGRNAMISRLELRQGCDVAMHDHANEQFTCILSGRVRFLLGDGDTRELGAGEVLHLPPFAPHGAIAVEDAILLDVFAPPSPSTGLDDSSTTSS
ncbi:MAG: DinB family protein [Planctomycetota bacterium]